MVDDVKPNAFETATKVKWLDGLEGTLAAEVFLMAPVETAQLRLSADNLEQELLIGPPYDDIYELWLEAQIDRANGEYNKYQNTMQSYNARRAEFVCWFCQNWDPAQGYVSEDSVSGASGRGPKERSFHFASTPGGSGKRGKISSGTSRKRGKEE